MVTKVKVEFIGQFRELTGVNGITLAVEDPATRDIAIEELMREFGGVLHERILDRGKLSEDALLILNGRSVRPADLKSISLKDGDNLILAPESAP